MYLILFNYMISVIYFLNFRRDSQGQCKDFFQNCNNTIGLYFNGSQCVSRTIDQLPVSIVVWMHFYFYYLYYFVVTFSNSQILLLSRLCTLPQVVLWMQLIFPIIWTLSRTRLYQV